MPACVERGLGSVFGIAGLVVKQATTLQQLLHAPADVRDLCLPRRLWRMERELAVVILGEPTIEKHNVEMDVKVQRAVELLRIITSAA